MISIIYSERFKKNYKKLTEVEKKQFKNKIKKFIEDSSIPSLRVKKIKGTENLFEFSVSMSIRWFGVMKDQI